MVPPKFLLSWLDGASLEVEDDSDLQEQWARLLISAKRGPKEFPLSYVDVLRKIGKDEAQLLREFAYDTKPDYSLSYYGVMGISDDFAEKSSEICRKAIDSEKISNVDIVKVFEEIAAQYNIKLLYVAKKPLSIKPTTFYVENERSISALEREGVISVRRESANLYKPEIELCWIELTKFGFDFVWACEGYTKRKNK